MNSGSAAWELELPGKVFPLRRVRCGCNPEVRPRDYLRNTARQSAAETHRFSTTWHYTGLAEAMILGSVGPATRQEEEVESISDAFRRLDKSKRVAGLRTRNPNRVSLILILAIVCLGLVWIALSKYAIPPLIESAYHGESLSIFNKMISGQASHPIGEYLTDWDRVRWRVLVSFF